MPLIPFNCIIFIQWQEQNKLQGNPPLRRFPESNLLPKKSPESLPPSPLASRNHTDSNPEQWLWEKSGNTRSPLIFSSENFLSKEWSEKSPMNGNKNSGSKALLFWPYKKLLKLTLFLCLKTPTCALSMPKEWQSWLVTCSWPKESEETDFDFFLRSVNLSHFFMNKNFYGFSSLNRKRIKMNR